MARMHKIKIRQSPKNKQFYTAILAPNGEPVFDGCEGHVKKAQADKMVEAMVVAIKAGNFKIVDELLTPKLEAGKKPAPKEKKKPVGKKKTKSEAALPKETKALLKKRAKAQMALPLDPPSTVQ